MHSASEIEELFQKLQKEVKDLLSAQKSICVIPQRSGSFSILQKHPKSKRIVFWLCITDLEAENYTNTILYND